MELLERLSARSLYVTFIFELQNLKKPQPVMSHSFQQTNKVMSNLLYSVYRDMKLFVREAVKMKEDVKKLKSSLIRSQNSVIKLQSERFEGKSKQLESVQTAVKYAVQESVEAEIRSLAS